jgi:hypothetical protein
MPSAFPSRRNSRKAKKSSQGVKILHPQPTYSPKSVPISGISLEDLPKIPSCSAGLQDASRLTREFSPLRSHCSPEPSTNSHPLPPHPSAIPPALRTEKSLPTHYLDTSDSFEEVGLGNGKHYSTEAPSSFVKEVDEKIAREFDVESLYSPDTVETEFGCYTSRSPELKRNLTLSSDTGSYRPKHQTTAFVDGISAGPYSVSDDHDKRFILYRPEQHPNTTPERRKGKQSIAPWLLMIVIGVVSVAGYVLAAVAISRSPVSAVLGNGASSLKVMTVPGTSLMDVSISTSDSIANSAHWSHSHKIHTTLNPLHTDASYRLLNVVIKREAIMFGVPTEIPCTTTTTTATSTVHTVQMNRVGPRDVAATSSRVIIGLYAAPVLDVVSKGIIRARHDHSMTTTTYSTLPTREKVIGHKTAKAAAPRITAPWPFGLKRASTKARDEPAKITYGLAYFELWSAVGGLCSGYRSSYLHHSEDDKMTNSLGQTLCYDAAIINWTIVDQQDKCPGKKEWDGMLGDVRKMCAAQKDAWSSDLAKGVDKFCGEVESYEGRVEGGEVYKTVSGSRVKRGYSTPSPTPFIPLIARTEDPALPPFVEPPSHFHLTPPASWSTVPMLTYPSQALNADYSSKYYPSNTIPTSLSSATPPPYTGPHLTRTWPENYPFAIPTGYVSPNIVPKEVQVGDLTFFQPGTGSCGSPDIRMNEYAVAISWVLFDIGREISGSSLEPGWQGTLPGGRSYDSSALCNRWINLWMMGEGGKKSVEHAFVVRDRCTACNVTHLDIQKPVFERFWGDKNLGRVQVSWEWMREGPTGLPGR